MRKQITALSLLLALLLTLCGCGGKSEAVKETERLIDAIGTVTVDSVSAVEAAEAAYHALSGDERAQVSNAAKLTAAREALDAALLDAVRAPLIGTWETETDVRDDLAAEMDGQFTGSDLTFADYLDECVLTLRLELREDGVYRLAFDEARLEDSRQTIRGAVGAFVGDYLLFSIAEQLKQSGIKGDFSTREGIEAAMGMGLDELVRNSLNMDLETYIDQVADEIDPAERLSAMLGEGRFALRADGSGDLSAETKYTLSFSAATDQEPSDGPGASYSVDGARLTVTVPDDAGFPLTGTRVFTRAG